MPAFLLCTCCADTTHWTVSYTHLDVYKRQLYSHLTYIKIVCNIIFAGELAHAFAMLCGFNVFIWSKVIHHKCDFIFVKYTLYIHFSDFMNCNRRSNIIAPVSYTHLDVYKRQGLPFQKRHGR